MKKVLVAGGAGFIGSHLIRKLIGDGKKVVCVDNFHTGNIRNIAKFDSSNFELVEHDVSEPLFLDVDEIYNLACPASPLHYQSDGVRTLKTSFLGSLNLLELAKKLGIRILQASTSEIYGDPEIHPQPEEYWGKVNPVGSRSCYDEGKRCAETLFYEFNQQYGVDTKIARIFNTYGPRMQIKDGRVVSNFIVQALRNNNITVYGSGDQTRSFCYVDDMVLGLTRMMDSESGVVGPINLGSQVEISVLELAKTVIRLTGSKSKIEFKALPPDDPKMRRPDTVAAKEKLGWQAHTTTDAGLSRTIEYFEKELAIHGRMA